MNCHGIAGAAKGPAVDRCDRHRISPDMRGAAR